MANEDPHAKQLLTAHPKDTVALFAPELLQAHGPVQRIEEVSPEIFNPDPQGRSGFLDMALKCWFADGSEGVLLLIEHWSSASKVDQRRVLRYVAELLYRHNTALVWPVLLITETTSAATTDKLARLHYALAGQTVLDAFFAVHVIDETWRQRVANQQNVVAAVLWVIPDVGPAIDRCLLALRTLCDWHAAGSIAADGAENGNAAKDEKGALQTLLVHITQFAKLNHAQKQEELQRRIEEDPFMSASIIDLIEAKGVQKGIEQGKIELALDGLRNRLAEGKLTLSSAHQEVEALDARGVITPAAAKAIIDQLV
jgi:hypothetical protein